MSAMAATTFFGRNTSPDRITIESPSAQITSRINGKPSLKFHPSAETVISRNTSHRPRVNRNLLTSLVDLPPDIARPAPTPARRKNVGAQKCVTHRVANRRGVDLDKSSG